MSEPTDFDSLLDEALAPAAPTAEVEVDARPKESVIQATPSSELVSPVNVLGDDDEVPAFLAEASASAELNIYPDGYQPFIEDGVALPRCASERVRAMSESDRAAWRKMRVRARTEPLFLANSLMGMSLQENPHAAFFLRLPKMVPGTPFSQLAEAGRKFMLLWSRSAGKTSCVRVFIMMCLLNYPNLRIGFLTGSKDLGKDQLKPIKDYFENPSPLFKALFPEYSLKSVKVKRSAGVVEWEDRIQELGTTTAFSVPCRTTRESVGHSFAVLSSDMRYSGMHLDILFCDDQVNNSNSATAAGLANTFQEYLQVTPLLPARGILIMTGTRYHNEDAYGQIIERYVELEHGNTQSWTFDIQGCYSKGPCVTCGHYEIFHDKHVNIAEPPCLHADCECKGFIADGAKYLLFPEVILPNGDAFGYTFEGLEAMRAQDEKFFNLQMLNEPLNSGHNVFNQPLINSCTLHDMKEFPGYPNLNIKETFICGDLAYGGDDGGKGVGDLADRDENVIYIFQVCLGCVWVWHCRHGRWTENQKLDQILSLIKQLRPNRVFFEQAVGWVTLKERLKDHAPSYGLTAELPITWTEVSNQRNSKALRIEQIEIAMQRSKIRLFAGMDGYDKLVKQLLAFPKSRHDDFMDGISQCLAAPTGVWAQSIPSPVTPMSQLRKSLGFDQIPVQEEYGDDGGGSGLACGGGGDQSWK